MHVVYTYIYRQATTYPFLYATPRKPLYISVEMFYSPLLKTQRARHRALCCSRVDALFCLFTFNIISLFARLTPYRFNPYTEMFLRRQKKKKKNSEILIDECPRTRKINPRRATKVELRKRGCRKKEGQNAWRDKKKKRNQLLSRRNTAPGRRRR